MKTIIELVGELNKFHSQVLDIQMQKKESEIQIKNLTQKISDFELEITKINKQITSITKEIGSAGQKNFDIPNENLPDGYNPTATNIKKAMFIIKRSGEFMTVREIFEVIAEFEPKYREEDYGKQLFGTLASVLGTKSKNEKSGIYRIEDPFTGDWKYGLNEWIKNDPPKEELIF